MSSTVEGGGTASALATAVVEARQYELLKDLDTAFFEGFTAAREAAGQDLHVANPLADGYGPYLAFRRELLRMKLVGEHAQRRDMGHYHAKNRFSLGACGDVAAPARESIPITSAPDTIAPQLQGSYAAWRRNLLALRFERRRAALGEEVVRRIAADAMRRAEEAEARERALERGEQPPGTEVTSLAGEGAARKGGAGPQPHVWRIRHHFDGLFVDGASPSEGDDWRPGSVRGGGAGVRDRARRPPPEPVSRSVTALAFAHDGQDHVAIGTEGGVVYLACATTGDRWATLTGHTGAITALDWSIGSSETQLVTVSNDRTARLWAVTLPVKRAPPPAPAPAPPTSGALATRRRSITRTPSSPPCSISPGASGAEAPTTPRSRAAAATAAAAGYDRAAERAKALRELEEERAAAAAAAAVAKGVILEGGAASCMRVITTDFPLTHVAFLPLNAAMFVAAGVEDADLEAEGAEGEGGAAGDVTAAPTTADGGTAAVRAVGGAFAKGFKGTVAAVKAVGGVTMGAIGAVPVVGGAVGATVSVIKGGMTAAVGGMAGMVGLGARRRERRGHLLVVHATVGRVVQDRRVQGSMGASLTKASSYITAMTFAPNGHQLFLADARGLVHYLIMETDPLKLQTRPLRDHAVIFGEGSATFIPIATAAAPTPTGGVRGGARGGGEDGGGADGGSSISSGPAGFGGGGGTVHLTSLVYRPLDSTLRCPLLLGLDSGGHVRALKLPPPTSGSVTSVPTGAARLAVGALGAVTGAVAVPSTASMVASEVAYVHYTAGLGAAVLAAAGGGWDASAGGSVGRGVTGSMGRGGAGSTAGRTAGFGYGGAVGGVGWGGGGVHSAMVPCRLTDAVVAGTPAGEVFVVAPHGNPTPPHGSRVPALSLGALVPPGSLGTVGAGIMAQQVAAKMLGHVQPIAHLALSKSESLLVSVDDGGELVVWERVPLSQADVDGGTSGYVWDDTPLSRSALALPATAGDGAKPTTGSGTGTIGRESGSMNAGSGSRMSHLLMERLNQGSLGRAAVGAAKAAASAAASAGSPVHTHSAAAGGMGSTVQPPPIPAHGATTAAVGGSGGGGGTMGRSTIPPPHPAASSPLRPVTAPSDAAPAVRSGMRAALPLNWTRTG